MLALKFIVISIGGGVFVSERVCASHAHSFHSNWILSRWTKRPVTGHIQQQQSLPLYCKRNVFYPRFSLAVSSLFFLVKTTPKPSRVKQSKKCHGQNKLCGPERSIIGRISLKFGDGIDTFDPIHLNFDTR